MCLMSMSRPRSVIVQSQLNHIYSDFYPPLCGSRLQCMNHKVAGKNQSRCGLVVFHWEIKPRVFVCLDVWWESEARLSRKVCKYVEFSVTCLYRLTVVNFVLYWLKIVCGWSCLLQCCCCDEPLKQTSVCCSVEGLIGESWQKVFVELYKDGTFVWYKKKNDRNTKGSVSLKVRSSLHICNISLPTVRFCFCFIFRKLHLRVTISCFCTTK